jgi:hypothetical protein
MIDTLIPIFNLTPLRRRNLEFIYQRLVDAGGDIIFGIQDQHPDLDYYSKFDKAKLVFCKSPSYNLFNKGRIFNFCSKQVNTKFFLFLDADIYISLNRILIREDDEVVKPFSQCVYLDQEKTLEFLEKRNTHVDEKYTRVSCLGGGAVIIKTEFALSQPLFDEKFLGWGWEDMDFGDLLRARFKIRTIRQPAVHLYHEPSPPNNENSAYYCKKEKPKSKIVHFFHFKLSNEVFISYLSERGIGVLLMNFSELDGLEEDSVKMCYMNDEEACLNFMISSSLPYVEDSGWVLYLAPFVKIETGFYQRVMSLKGHALVIDLSGRVVGFALKKSDFKGFGESIGLDGSYLERVALLLRQQGCVEINLQTHPCHSLMEPPNTSYRASASMYQES